MAIFWAIVFIISLVALVKGTDWFLQSSETIGFALGLSPFIIGIIIVGLGTSLPELLSSIVATLQGVTDVPVANAVGSNIANILLIVGIAAVIGKRLAVTRSLIELDLPLLAISTAIVIGVLWDGAVSTLEAVLLIAAFLVHLHYSIYYKEEVRQAPAPPVPESGTPPRKKRITQKDVALLVIGLLGLVLGAKYLIDAVVQLSRIFNIATGVIAASAVALGTSLPELSVSIAAARRHKPEIVLGNIFGSNAFNVLMVIGLPGLFGTLTVDAQTLTIGIPTMAIATLFFVISGISQRIYLWEGALYLMLYVLFIGKLFGVL
ncbi:sodium:calcium antiporter [Candidatus Parcubacteria bacterium]|nr:MAG: sodium:calcium antiporter [Candidatus Parcubacteria bacterium]